MGISTSLQISRYYDFFRDKENTTKLMTGNTKITVMDASGNTTICGGTGLKVAFDNKKPECEINDVQNSSTDKNILFTKISDDFTPVEKITGLIKKGDTAPASNLYKGLTGYKFSLYQQTDGI